MTNYLPAKTKRFEKMELNNTKKMVNQQYFNVP